MTKKFNYKEAQRIAAKVEFQKEYEDLQEMEMFLVDQHVADMASSHYVQ